MREISDGNITLMTEDLGKELCVRLSPTQYQSKKLLLFRPFLEERHFLLKGEAAEPAEENLEIRYMIPQGARSVRQESLKGARLQRLAIAQKFGELLDWRNRELHIFIHPDNFYLNGGRLQAAHRGLLDIVQPEEAGPAEFLKQYQALIISVLNPKYDYETLLKGAAAVREPFCREILEVKGPEEAARLVDRQYQALREEQERSERTVKKTRYSFFRWGFFSLAATALGLGVWCGGVFGYTVPLQERIIDSQSAFLVKNYGKATDILEHDDGAALPKSAQYVLAASYVNLEGMTGEEKTSVLNNLSVSNSPQELQYWIFTGRGELDKALDVAKVLGNKPWILNAYYKLRDATEINTKISGEEKQKLLQEYEKQILDYEKAVGGHADEIQK